MVEVITLLILLGRDMLNSCEEDEDDFSELCSNLYFLVLILSKVTKTFSSR